MKTNANRASHKAGKKPASAQSAKTGPGEAPKPQIKIRIVAELGETRLGEKELPGDITAAMVHRVNEEGFQSLPGLAAFMLDHQMRDWRRRGYCPSAEFEVAIQRATAMLDLLQSKLCGDLADKTHSGCPDYDPRACLKLGGYIQMIDHAEKALLSTFQNMFAWLQGKEVPESVQAEGGAR